MDNIEDRKIEEEKVDKKQNINLVFDKNKEKINIYREELEIKKEIEKDELSKTRALLDLGILTYEKFRKQEVCDCVFDEICEEVFELDKSIFENNLKLEKLKMCKIQVKCQCGNELNLSDKFCAKCGKKVEQECENIITCEFCEAKIDDDSRYCSCCGKRI